VLADADAVAQKAAAIIAAEAREAAAARLIQMYGQLDAKRDLDRGKRARVPSRGARASAGGAKPS
jgi:hypothetical protein